MSYKIVVVKSRKEHIKLLICLMSFLILFHGCTVYNSRVVNLEQAEKESIKTKVETYNDIIFKFKYIEKSNGDYYGVHKVNGKLERVKLSEKYIKTIKTKNKTLSVILPIGGVIGVTLGTLAILGFGEPMVSGSMPLFSY